MHFTENNTLFKTISEKNTIVLYLNRKELDPHVHFCIQSVAISFSFFSA